mgnify:CR=1 FL=1
MKNSSGIGQPRPDSSNRQSSNPGLGLAFSSALFYTSYDVGVRSLIGDLSVWGMLFLRGCVGLTVMLVLARIFSRPLWGRQTPLLLLIGFFAFGSSICNAISLSSIPLYQALMIIYFYPVFTLLLAGPVNGEPVTGRDLTLTLLAVAGGMALVWPDQAVGLEFRPQHIVGIGGAFLYSLGQVSIRRMGPGNSGLEPIFFYSLYAFFLAVPMSMIFNVELGLNSFGGVGGAFILATLGISAQLSGYAALRWIPGFKVGIIGYLELLIGGFISWLVFSDPMGLRALAGGMIVVFAVFQLRKSRAAPSKSR